MKKTLMLILPLALLMLNACGTREFYLNVTRPAEINMKDYTKVIIEDFSDGIGGKNIHCVDIGEKFISSIFETGYFEVLDRKNLDKILAEHKLTLSGIVDENNSTELGKIVGAAALIVGTLQMDKYDESISKDDPYVDKKGVEHQTIRRNGSYQLTLTIKVIDIETAKILAVKYLQSTSHRSTSADKKNPPEIDPESLYNECVYSVLSQFIRMIAPYQEALYAEFETDEQLPELESAIAMFQAGEWKDGLDILKACLTKTGLKPEILAKAYYNYGLALMLDGQYDACAPFIKKAMALQPGSSRYAYVLGQAKSEKTMAEELAKQQK